MKIEFINVWFKKNRLMNVKVGILGLNFLGKNDIMILNKKPVQVSVKLKMREKGFILYWIGLFLWYNCLSRNATLITLSWTGGGNNGKLGFDCFGSCNRIAFDF